MTDENNFWGKKKRLWDLKIIRETIEKGELSKTKQTEAGASKCTAPVMT